MPKYVFVYHGGTKPQSDAEYKNFVSEWHSWYQSMGADVVDTGGPVGMSKTVMSNSAVVDNGGANPASGYGLFNASSMEDALEKAKKCPLLTVGGNVEVAEALEVA